MLPKFLLPECIARADGTGPEIDVGPDRGKLLVVTLCINRAIEQESLIVSTWGSPDKTVWGTHPLVLFPQKYYCGMYSVLLNLAKHPEVQYLRVEWKIKRWGKGDPTPMFGFFIFAEQSGSRVSAAVA